MAHQQALVSIEYLSLNPPIKGNYSFVRTRQLIAVYTGCKNRHVSHIITRMALGLGLADFYLSATGHVHLGQAR